ncbi:putative uncharacterized protein GUCA1ANB isoform X1 [Monodelphis domestica]|uniref:putative uncharacterized protein GUCA1ANB isoform X1 n=1 Tax=Monodelphis domestica TaxID=13616 RepID=UPI0024E2246D|nr:putative uncharacterized protein GUCA1ANB isoform X1 [Monodelphis domestica]
MGPLFDWVPWQQRPLFPTKRAFSSICQAQDTSKYIVKDALYETHLRLPLPPGHRPHPQARGYSLCRCDQVAIRLCSVDLRPSPPEGPLPPSLAPGLGKAGPWKRRVGLLEEEGVLAKGGRGCSGAGLIGVATCM